MPFKPFNKRDDKKKRKPGARRTFFRKRICRFCVEKIKAIDYKDVMRLRKHITEKGKILPSRISGACAKHQRLLARAIKQGRTISLLPYTAE